MALKLAEYEQLVKHIFDSVEEALATHSRTDMRECLETISDLTDDENTLAFNEDGSVEIEAEDEASGDGEADENDESDD